MTPSLPSHRLAEAQLRFLISGGLRPECAVSQLILAVWGDLTAPSASDCLRLLKIAQRIELFPRGPHVEKRREGAASFFWKDEGGRMKDETALFG